MTQLWKFTKGPYKGTTAIEVDKEKLSDATPKHRDMVTLYINSRVVSFTKEALEQIADRIEES